MSTTSGPRVDPDLTWPGALERSQELLTDTLVHLPADATLEGDRPGEGTDTRGKGIVVPCADNTVDNPPLKYSISYKVRSDRATPSQLRDAIVDSFAARNWEQRTDGPEANYGMSPDHFIVEVILNYKDQLFLRVRSQCFNGSYADEPPPEPMTIEHP